MHDESKRPLPTSSMAEREVVEVKAGVFKDRCLRFLDLDRVDSYIRRADGVYRKRPA